MKYFNQDKLFNLSFRSQKIILILFLLILTIGLFEALVLSPEDYLQGDAVRIMYVHVPAAWTSLGIFSIIAFLSILVFIFKNKNFFLIGKSLCFSYRINLGQTHVGHLVGLGCKNYINVNISIILFDVFNCLENI